jgi:hypothetical protein
LKEYNNYVATQLSQLTASTVDKSARQAILAESQSREAAFKGSAERAILRFHEMALGKSLP